MAPVRSYGNWHIRKSDQEPTVNPYCKYYFIAEGANTEKFYFEKGKVWGSKIRLIYGFWKRQKRIKTYLILHI